MEDQKQTSFTFEINNFWEKKAVISRIISSGGCEWFVDVYPNGYGVKDHLSLYFGVVNSESLKPGWKRRANISIVLLNQSGQVLKIFSEYCYLFCAHFSKRGTSRALPLKKVIENGSLENKLIVKFEIKVVEVVDEGEVTGKEMLDVCGFQVPYPQVNSVSQLFEEHPYIAEDFTPKHPLVKAAYMSVLLGLIETLNKPPHSFTETELGNARRELNELMEAGFNIHWLWRKLDEVSFERMANAALDRLELNKEKVKDWLKGLVHSWNEWKLRVGFADLLNEKIDKNTY